MNSISFTANYITSINVLRKNSEDKYQSTSVNVAKVDYYNKNDRKAIKDISDKWVGTFFCDDIQDFKHNNLWIVTTQNNDQNLKYALNPNEILGFVNMKFDRKKTKIFHIETIPKSVNSDYDYVGTSIMEYLQTKTKQIDLFCPSTKIIEQFYYQLGFNHKAPNSNKMINYGELYWFKNPKSINATIYRLFNKIYYSFKK